MIPGLLSNLLMPTPKPDTVPIKVLIDRLIRDMCKDMRTVSPSEKRAIAGAIASLTGALPGLSGMDDTMQTAMLELITELKTTKTSTNDE